MIYTNFYLINSTSQILSKQERRIGIHENHSKFMNTKKLFIVGELFCNLG